LTPTLYIIIDDSDSIQVLVGFKDKRHSVWPQNGSILFASSIPFQTRQEGTHLKNVGQVR
jgi:hypothetical protein